MHGGLQTKRHLYAETAKIRYLLLIIQLAKDPHHSASFGGKYRDWKSLHDYLLIFLASHRR